MDERSTVDPDDTYDPGDVTGPEGEPAANPAEVAPEDPDQFDDEEQAQP
jgi:hypothetical protein